MADEEDPPEKSLAEQLREELRKSLADRPSQGDAALRSGEQGEEVPDSQLPELRTFVGYDGEKFEYEGVRWCRLYLDVDFRTWLIIERDGVVMRRPIDNEQGPKPGRLVVWVRPDAAVGRGMRSLSREGEFLTGGFTRAGDFDVGAGGGTPDASTGVFCEARSVGCCMGRTNRPPRP